MNTRAGVAVVAVLATGCELGGLSDPSVDAAGADAVTVACGDPGLVARYAACMATTEEVTCLAAGGTWRRVGLSNLPRCACPTGQSACPCTLPGDCLAGCRAPLQGSGAACGGLTDGRCSSVGPKVGCACWFEGGEPQPICID